MNAKQYLLQYETLKGQCDLLLAEIETMRADAEAVNQVVDGMPKAPGVADRVGNVAVKLADKWKEYEYQLMDLWQLRTEITTMISKLDSATHSRLLYDRYIKLMKWAEVANDIYMDEVYTRGALHGAALQALEKILLNTKTTYTMLH